MSKNDNYKQDKNTVKKEFSKKKTAIIIGGAAAAALIVIYLIVSLVSGSFVPTKWGKSEKTPTETEKTIICAVIYPDLQDDGAIWQTGGMAETHAHTLREALETDFGDGFAEFFDNGKIKRIGGLSAAGDYSFKIQRNTTRSPEELSDIPSDITLSDNETYEILFVGKDGESVTKLTDKIKEDINEAQKQQETDNTVNATDATGGDDSPTDSATEPSSTEPAKPSTDPATEPTKPSTNPTEATGGTTSDGDNWGSDIF